MGFGDKVKRMLEKGAAKTEELAKTGKLKFEIAAINSRISDKKILLGDKAYSLIKEGKINEPQLSGIVEEIDKFQAQIKEKQSDTIGDT